MRLGVLIGGSGRTLKNFVAIGLDVAVVVGHRINLTGFQHYDGPKFACDDAGMVFDIMRRHDVELVCMAGWIRFLEIAPDFQGRVMNIHPSLLPSFGGKGMFGMSVHRSVLKAGVKVSGCTVHFAGDQYDTGPIILQRVVPVRDTDTPEELAARVFAEELVAYPDAIRLFAAGALKIDGKRVVLA